MGSYTELIFGAHIKMEPSIELEALGFLFGNTNTAPDILPNHPFFKCARWDLITCCSSSYFPSSSYRYFYRHENRIECSSRANLKNYEDEISLFLDWIKPYIIEGAGEREFYAIVTYEEGEPQIHYLK